MFPGILLIKSRSRAFQKTLQRGSLRNMPQSIKIAIQEDMLPGPTLEDRFQQAAKLGAQGIEFWGETLPDQIEEIERLNGSGAVVASSINNGRRSRFLDPDPDERERALAELRMSISLAGRIGAAGVGFVPHFFEPLLPDLSPWMDTIALERALLTAQLVSLADAALEAGIQLWVEPVNRSETHLLVALEQAASLIEPLDHPHLGIVADLYHMAYEGVDIPTTLIHSATSIGVVHLADSNRRLPGQGNTDFNAALGSLKETGFDGWFVYECDEPGNNHTRASKYFIELPDSFALIRKAFG